MSDDNIDTTGRTPDPDEPKDQPETATPEKPSETGGPKGLEPTRYGDWERKGIVSDF